MIKINALYFLLLIELLVIFAGLIAFLVFREKKRILVYRESKRELDKAHAAKEELSKHLAARKAGATLQSTDNEGGAAAKTPQAPGVNTKDHDACKREITVLEETVKEKTRLLVDLQAKLDSVEKEYLFLYQQQQAQDQKKT
jgi:hypothetical protein